MTYWQCLWKNFKDTLMIGGIACLICYAVIMFDLDWPIIAGIIFWPAMFLFDPIAAFIQWKWQNED